MRPERVASETLYNGRVFSITLDTIREDGHDYSREIVHHHGSAVIAPLFDDGTLALSDSTATLPKSICWNSRLVR
ncbi:MAG: hypothetical protein R2682_11185 [Pyrinomonadaceae bacterium]